MTTQATTLGNSMQTARSPRRTPRRYRVRLISLAVAPLATLGAGCAVNPRITTTSDAVTLMHLKTLRDGLVATDWHYDSPGFSAPTFVAREVPYRYGDWGDAVPARRGALRFAWPAIHLPPSPRETPFTLTTTEPSRPAPLIESTTLTLAHGTDPAILHVPTIADRRALGHPAVLTMLDQGPWRRGPKTSAKQGLIPLSDSAARGDGP